MSVVERDAIDESPADVLTIAGHEFGSRLIVGTGKYKDLDETRRAIEASGSELVTVAVRRTNIGQNADEPNLLDVISPDRYTILPNTAGSHTSAEAIRSARIGRELLEGSGLLKLEVVGDDKTLYPDMIETLQATEKLAREGFEVMAYTSDDPLMVRRAEEAGAVAVMPLAAPIGSGLGIQNRYNLREIVDSAEAPIVVDAGVGTASDAALAMEFGCDGVLMNSAIALARDPVRMAGAMRRAMRAGRDAWLAGRIPKKRYASASSPETGLFF